MLNWEDILQKYIIKHTKRISKTTQPLKNHFGIGYFTYHRIDNEGKYTVLVDSPEWAEHYVSERFYLLDPYLGHPSIYQSGISLIQSHGTEEYKEKVIIAGKKVLNMDVGAILIQKRDDCVEFFGFSANRNTSSLENVYLNHPQLLTSFSKHFKKEMGPLLTEMEKEAGSLTFLKGRDFYNHQPICPNIGSKTLLEFYKDLGLKCEAEKAEKLSRRERECLQLLIEDKSAKETATALGLSRRTIEFYFENIKNKLGCWNKQEVLKIARTLNDIGLL